MKRPDLLILLSVWEFITAFLALVGVVILGVFAFPGLWDMWGGAQATGIFILTTLMLVLLTFCGLAVASGVGLMLGKEWGRIAALVHSGLSALWVPIGTVVGVLALVYLTRPEIREYFNPPQD